MNYEVTSMNDTIVVKIDKDLEDIIPSFLENRRKDLEKVKDAISQNDFKTIESIAHKLAGNAGSYGLDDLGEIGMKLEVAASKEEFPLVEELFQNYRDYMNKLTIEFQ